MSKNIFKPPSGIRKYTKTLLAGKSTAVKTFVAYGLRIKPIEAVAGQTLLATVTISSVVNTMPDTTTSFRLVLKNPDGSLTQGEEHKVGDSNAWNFTSISFQQEFTAVTPFTGNEEVFLEWKVVDGTSGVTDTVNRNAKATLTVEVF